jgi:hypothetical protein
MARLPIETKSYGHSNAVQFFCKRLGGELGLHRILFISCVPGSAEHPHPSTCYLDHNGRVSPPAGQRPADGKTATWPRPGGLRFQGTESNLSIPCGEYVISKRLTPRLTRDPTADP